MKWSQPFQAYFDQYKDLAIEQMFALSHPGQHHVGTGRFRERSRA
jgi:hypothetical protein